MREDEEETLCPGFPGLQIDDRKTSMFLCVNGNQCTQINTNKIINHNKKFC